MYVKRSKHQRTRTANRPRPSASKVTESSFANPMYIVRMDKTASQSSIPVYEEGPEPRMDSSDLKPNADVNSQEDYITVRNDVYADFA